MKVKLYLMMLVLLMTAVITVSTSAQKSAQKKEVIINEKSAMKQERKRTDISDDLLITEFSSKVQRIFLLKSVLDRGLENEYDRDRMLAVVSEMDGLLAQIQNSSEPTGMILQKVNTGRGTSFCDWFPCEWDKLRKLRDGWEKYNRNNQGAIELSKAVNQQASELRLVLKDVQKEIEAGKPSSRKIKINWDKVWTAVKCAAGTLIGLYGGATGNEDIYQLGEQIVIKNC